jgi:hypothetical protein
VSIFAAKQEKGCSRTPAQYTAQAHHGSVAGWGADCWPSSSLTATALGGVPPAIIDVCNSGATASADPTAGDLHLPHFAAPFPNTIVPTAHTWPRRRSKIPSAVFLSRRGGRVRYAVQGPGGHLDVPPVPARRWRMRWEEALHAVPGAGPDGHRARRLCRLGGDPGDGRRPAKICYQVCKTTILSVLNLHPVNC